MKKKLKEKEIKGKYVQYVISDKKATEEDIRLLNQSTKKGKLITKVEVDIDDKDLKKHIEVLIAEIQVLTSRFEPTDTGHLRTTVSVLEERVGELMPIYHAIGHNL